MSFIAVAIGGGALIGGITSIVAGHEQAGAAKDAAQLEAESQQKALDFQKQVWNTQQQNEAPFLKSGQGAVTKLSSLMGTDAFAPWTKEFQAPTAEQAAQTPGYQFQLQQGEQALQNSQAAAGGALSTGALKGINNYAQGVASTNYQQTYNNALQNYQQSYNQYQQNQANLYNRYSNLAGFGQVSAGQLGQQGQGAATNVGNLFMTGAAQQAQQMNNAAAANASGYVGAGNAASGALNNFSQYAMLKNLLGNQTQTPSVAAP